MKILSLAVALLQSSSLLVQAFSPVLSRPRRCTTTRRQAIAEDDFLFLMDEAVMLHSKIDRSSQSSSSEVDLEMKELRRSELTTFVEDLVIDQFGEDPVEEPSKDSLDNFTLMELSTLLDSTMMEGYEANFTEEELEAWVHRVETLRDAVQERLANPQPKITAAKETVKDFATRLAELQQYETLIAPGSPARQEVASPAVSTPSSASAPVQTQSITEASFEVPKETQALSDTELEILEATVVVEASGEIHETIEAAPANDSEAENASTIGSSQVSPLKTIEPTGSEENKTEAIEATLVDESDDNLEHAAIEQSAAKAVAHSPAAEDPEKQTADKVSAFISAAAIGAVAVTKLPVFAAGIALGPIVQQSIDYARSRQAASRAKKLEKEKAAAKKKN